MSDGRINALTLRTGHLEVFFKTPPRSPAEARFVAPASTGPNAPHSGFNELPAQPPSRADGEEDDGEEDSAPLFCVCCLFRGSAADGVSHTLQIDRLF